MQPANTTSLQMSSLGQEAHENRLFSRITWLFLTITLMFALVVKIVSVPELTRAQKSKVPPQLTKIIERVKIEERPKPEPKPIEDEKEEKPVVKKEPEIVKKPELIAKPVIVQSQEEKIDVAREQAKQSGLLAMQDDLAQLREIAQMSAPISDVALSTQGSESAIVDATPVGDVYASNVATLDGSAVSQTVGKRVDLTKQKLTALADKAVNEVGEAHEEVIEETQLTGGRDVESIRKVLDRNKGAFYTIYRRALRKDPSLEGKVEMLIVVAPDGHVANCSIISSELNDGTLERKLLARVKLINFGAQNVEETSISYSFNFLPF